MAITFEEISKLKVVDLKIRLLRYGLSTSGLKNDLVQRLFSHHQATQETEANQSSQDNTGDQPNKDGLQPPGEEPHSDNSTNELRLNIMGPVDRQDQDEPMEVSEQDHKLPLRNQAYDPSDAYSRDAEEDDNVPATSNFFMDISSKISQIREEELLKKAREQEEMLERQKEEQKKMLAEQVKEQHRIMEEMKVREQQRLLDQQQQEDLFRIQQAALLEKQREEQEKQAQLLRLQQEALKQKEEEKMITPSITSPSTPQPLMTVQVPKIVIPAGPVPLMAQPIGPPPGFTGQNIVTSSSIIVQQGVSTSGLAATLSGLPGMPQGVVRLPLSPAFQPQGPTGPRPLSVQGGGYTSPIQGTSLLGASPGTNQIGKSPGTPQPLLRMPLIQPRNLPSSPGIGQVGNQISSPTTSQHTPVHRPPLSSTNLPRPQGLLGSAPSVSAPLNSSPQNQGNSSHSVSGISSISTTQSQMTQGSLPLGGTNHSLPKQISALQPSSAQPTTQQGLAGNKDSNQGTSEKDRLPSLMSLQVAPPKEEVKLPQALEQALAFKSERAKQVGVNPEDMEKIEREGMSGMDEIEKIAEEKNNLPSRPKLPESFVPASLEDDEDETGVVGKVVSQQKSKHEKNRKKKKKKRKGRNRAQEEIERRQMESRRKDKKSIDEPTIEIEYIQETIELDHADPNYRYFYKVFENFRIAEPEVIPEVEKPVVKTETPFIDHMRSSKGMLPLDDDDSDDDEDAKKAEEDKPKLSKRKMKLKQRMSIAELKQTVSRPDVVEMHDVTAKDPKVLVHLKATRNTVPVPRHWCFKRKYLQGKRGIEKPPFELPDFIKRTDIMEMRAALQEKEDQKTLKAKMRDKVRPKMGKIDIDYQKFHDAFFKWQTKPKMTIHGDLYYEGKEFETKMKDKKPGEMSDDLRIALGMPIGASAHKVPPPWLIAMQRYGPPPSYPNLKIPGLNSPIPDTCSFGYHAGGWGKPPVDNMGKPIYGDVFGTSSKDFDAPMAEEEVEKTMWGELESESEEESEEESDEDDDEDVSGLVTPGETGLVTPSGFSSLPAGLETPDLIELRKKRMETEMEGGDTPALYTILPEKRNENIGRAMMGSTHTYDLGAATGPTRSTTQGVEVALDPSELDLVDTDAMAARYEATLREQQKGDDEDFSDMVAEHAAKQRNKRRKQQQEQKQPAKKYKDFKF